MPPEHRDKTIPIIPGFDTLKAGAMRNILEYARNSGFAQADPEQLESLKLLPLDVIDTLLTKEYFGAGGDLSMCIRDRGNAIRTALRARRDLLIDASRHAGFNIPGAQDLENNLRLIRESQDGPDTNPEDEYPF